MSELFYRYCIEGCVSEVDIPGRIDISMFKDAADNDWVDIMFDLITKYHKHPIQAIINLIEEDPNLLWKFADVADHTEIEEVDFDVLTNREAMILLFFTKTMPSEEIIVNALSEYEALRRSVDKVHVDRVDKFIGNIIKSFCTPEAIIRRRMMNIFVILDMPCTLATLKFAMRHRAMHFVHHISGKVIEQK